MIVYEIDGLADVGARIRRVTAVLSDPEAFWAAVDDYLNRRTDRVFDTEGGEIGVRWADLEERYAAAKRRRWGDVGILVASGAGRRSLTSGSDPQHVADIVRRGLFRWGSRDFKMGWHDSPEPGARYPQRMIVAFNGDDTDAFEEMLHDIVADAWQGLAA